MFGTTYTGNWSMQGLRMIHRVVNWKLRFCLFPKYCYLTGDRIWLEHAYYGENWIIGPGEPIVEKLWVKRHEFLLWQLTR